MKKIVLLLSAVAAVFLFWFYQKITVDDLPFVKSNEAIPIAIHSIQERPPTFEENFEAQNAVSAEEAHAWAEYEKYKHLLPTEQDFEDMRVASQKRELEDSAQRLYASYSESMLIDLADQGDLMAIKQLYNRYLHALLNDPKAGGVVTIESLDRQQQAHDRVEKYLYEAILHGDRELLERGDRLFVTHPDPVNPANARAVTLDNLAFFEFVGMRGKRWESYHRKISVVNVAEMLNGPLNLSEAEKAAIHNRAQQIYDELESKRIELGLGPFDNSVSQWELKSLESYRQQFPDGLSENDF